MKVDDHEPLPSSTEGREMDEGGSSAALYNGINWRPRAEGKLYPLVRTGRERMADEHQGRPYLVSIYRIVGKPEQGIPGADLLD